MAGLQETQPGDLQNSRTGIGWQEVVAVLFGIVGGAVYAIFAKQPKNRKVVVFAISFALNLVGVFLPSNSLTSTSQPVVQSSPESARSINEDAQAILTKIEQQYGFSRFIDTWGMGTQGLFLPEAAWNSLSSTQKQTLIDYAQSKGFKAIIVGRLLGTNNIALDRTVWGE